MAALTSTLSGFLCAPLMELARQMLGATPQRRAELAARAEALHDLIDPRRAYPLDFLHFRLTGNHQHAEEESLLVGEAVLTDLRRLIDLLSRSAPQPVAEASPAASVRELAARLGVSTKTITRWRQEGLRWRWVLEPGATRPRVGFPPDAVAHFVQQHPQRVEKAAAFSQMSAAQRRAVLDRARRIAQAVDVSMHRVAVHLARKTGRSPETLRQLFEQHDRRHPQRAIFVRRTGPLSARQKRLNARAMARGVRIQTMCRRFGRTRSTLYRAQRQHRAEQLRRLPVRYALSPTFQRPDAEAVFLRSEADPPAPSPDGPNDAMAAGNGDLPPALQAAYAAPALPPDRERALLARWHYLKYRLAHGVAGLDRRDPRAGELDRLESFAKEIARLHPRLWQANLGRVLAVARQHLIDRPQASQNMLLGLLELGQTVLAETLEEFDPFQGRAFDHLLSWRLRRTFATRDADAALQNLARRRLTPEMLLRRLEQLQTWPPGGNAGNGKRDGKRIP